MQQVRDLAHWLGWSTYHTHRSERSEKGFPDLVLIKPSRGGQPARLIFSELKSIKGKLTPEQSRWLEVLGQVPNVETFCWRPHDWDQSVSILQTDANAVERDRLAPSTRTKAGRCGILRHNALAVFCITVVRRGGLSTTERGKDHRARVRLAPVN